MRKTIDEVASFILLELMKSESLGDVDVVSLPAHSEIVSILECFFIWAKKYNKIKEENLVDISSII